MISAAASTGVASTVRNAVTSVVQVNSGRRNIVIPGARSRKIVTRKLMPPAVDAAPSRISPINQRSIPTPSGCTLAPVFPVTGG